MSQRRHPEIRPKRTLNREGRNLCEASPEPRLNSIRQWGRTRVIRNGPERFVYPMHTPKRRRPVFDSDASNLEVIDG